MLNRDLLERCSNAAGASGFEGGVRTLLASELQDFCDITETTAGNLVCRMRGAAGGPVVALLAHMDEIGFMVQGVTPDGFLLIVPLGGWWNHTLPSQRVLVHTRDGRVIPGQIGTRPPHLLPESQRNQVMATDSLFIDIGASSAEEVAACGVRIGCAVTPDVQMQELAVPHRWMGKAFDNRAGVYCMIETMRRLAGESLNCTLQAVGTVQEEVGTRGARALEQVPDLAIILEGPPADDTYGQSGVCRQGVLGQGVQVRLFDPTNITPPELADKVLELAGTEGIACQPTVRRTGGTDAAAAYPHWHGCPAIVFGVPVRYIHSHNGILDDRDLEACIQLTCALVRSVGK
ncbi:MAG: M20/M25/M40 family metallo-hydrolase [Akkermansia sp.]|nr:M20/M25/M40 family metallo-hydrolase [Akkermansia sp.]MBR2313520.1 M20/M25/M40 family metallo-hydrolase [Akkermansia sp.]